MHMELRDNRSNICSCPHTVILATAWLRKINLKQTNVASLLKTCVLEKYLNLPSITFVPRISAKKGDFYQDKGSSYYSLTHRLMFWAPLPLYYCLSIKLRYRATNTKAIQYSLKDCFTYNKYATSTSLGKKISSFSKKQFLILLSVHFPQLITSSLCMAAHQKISEVHTALHSEYK